MLFNSFIFIIYFIVVLATLPFLRRVGTRNTFLLCMSCIFYGAWDWRFLFLLFLSITIDYWISLKIADTDCPKRRKALLISSIFVNLGILGFFKYFNFFVDSFQVMLASVGLNTNPWIFHVILPVGISFYTFQSMSYTIDVYRGHLSPTRSFRDYALYVSFFPQLVAGPIVRASDLLPQLSRPVEYRPDRVREGFFLILYGFFKKVVVADNLSVYVDQTFSKGEITSVDVVIGAIGFAFQIYADFSGYSDIARGVAKWMGFDFQLNFNFPYFARNPQEFWHRWHITLSQWLRDYLYVPLGGSRKGELRTYINLGLTMLLGGLWHGAAWNFVIWGAYHGMLLIIHRFWYTRIKAKYDFSISWLPVSILNAASIAIMFCFTLYGWLIFRVSGFEQLLAFTEALFVAPRDAEWISVAVKVLAYSALVVVFDATMCFFKRDNLATRIPLFNLGWALFFFYMIVIFGYDGKNSFIYFAF